jgi:hypothetical protein
MARSLRPRRSLTAVATVLLTVLSTLLATPAAHATPTTLVHCEGSFTVTYDPPLTSTLRLTEVTFHNELDSCLGGVTSGDASGEFSAIRSCTTLDLPPHPATTTFFWNTGAFSTIAFSLSTVDRLVNGSTVVTSYGTVTQGFDQGAQAIHTAVQPQLDLIACAGAGVAQLTGPEVLQLI